MADDARNPLGESEIDRILSQYSPPNPLYDHRSYLAEYLQRAGQPEPNRLSGPPTLPDVRPREMREAPLGQSNALHRMLSSFGQPSLDALRQGMEGRATPSDVAQSFLTTGPVGPFGMVRPAMSSRVFDWTPGGGSRDARIGPTDVTYGVARDGTSAELILVRTPREHRGQGHARGALQQFVSEADENAMRLFLNADPMDRGVTRGGLDRLYRSLGFVKNTGRNKDFTSTAGYVRYPQSRPSE